MSIYYKVEWLQEIYGIKFCVARAVYSEKEISKTYELFILKHDRTNPLWAHDVSIAEYSAGDYFEVDFRDKGLITDYFQKEIQNAVTEQIRRVYDYIESRRKDALKGIYPSWARVNFDFDLDRHEMEEICSKLVEMEYLKSFYTTCNGVCLQVKAKNLFEKLHQIIF